jgi:putative FmdB family regulatory protein
MPTYDFSCLKCDCEFELLVPLSEYDNAQECPKCQSYETKRLLSPVGFILKGSGWPGRDMKFKGHKAHNNKRLDKKQHERRMDSPGMTLAPNVEGMKTDSWEDARKLAASKNKNTDSYEPMVRKEKAKKQGKSS